MIEIKSNRQINIQLTRVLSMIMIVICHIIDEYPFIPGHTILPQVFNVGVYTFFVLSGFLYGKKNIEKFSSWFVKRIKKIFLPAFVVTITTILVLYFVFGIQYDIITYIVHLLCLQGFEFLWGGKHIFEGIAPLAALWFITVILICYLLTPIFQRIRSIFKTPADVLLTITFLLIARFILLLYCHIDIIYFITYLTGYLFSSTPTTYTHKKNTLIFVSILAFVSQAIRIVLQLKFDGTFIYSSYCNVSHLILGFWIFYICATLCRQFPLLCKRLGNTKALSFLDEYSFYIYLTHGLFCTSVYRLDFPLGINTILFFFLTIVSTILLKYSVVGIEWLAMKHKQAFSSKVS